MPLVEVKFVKWRRVDIICRLFLQNHSTQERNSTKLDIAHIFLFFCRRENEHKKENGETKVNRVGWMEANERNVGR